MASHSLLQVATLTVFALLVAAAPSPATSKACAAIKTELGAAKLLGPKDSGYKKENKDYWNFGLVALGPACIAMPKTAQDVSKIVNILNKSPSVEFAVKSGGHDPNVGHSSTKDGVLIAMRNVFGTEYDRARNVAYVKPGGHWSDVIVPLAKQGVTVVSGRLGIVGIGGLLLQGGNSFLTAQHGMAADNVLEWETVLANGTIANIKASERPELARAMRGGGSQFGIVTKFTLRAYPIGNVWGGERSWAAKDAAAVFEGFADFVENNHKDPKAAVIFTANGGATSAQMVYFDEKPPPPNAFGKLGAVKASKDSTKMTTYPAIIQSTDWILKMISMYTSFRSITLPHLPKDHGYYSRIDAMWNNITATRAKGRTGLTGITTTLAYQPWSRSIGKASAARGGNSMGLTANDGDRFVIEIAGIYQKKEDEKLVHDMSREFTDMLEKDLENIKAKAQTMGAQIETYLPHFMNDAAVDQDVMATYKDRALFARLQKEVDPTGLFSKRAGGFKY